jgi:hypothetical protein
MSGGGGGGGYAYQADAFAFVSAHALAEQPLNWFEDVGDVPVAVSMETGGPGDDLGVELRGGGQINIQCKRGAKEDHLFTDAFLRAAQAAHPANLRVIVPRPAFNELKAWFGCAAILRFTGVVVVTLSLPLLKVELTMRTTAKTDAIGFSVSSEGPGHFAMPTKEQRQEQVAKFPKQS